MKTIMFTAIAMFAIQAAHADVKLAKGLNAADDANFQAACTSSVMKEIATQEILESFKSLFQSASEKQIRDFSDSFSVEPKLAYGIDKSVLQQHKDPNSVSNAQQDQNFYVVFMKESRLSSTSEFVADYYQ